MDIATRNTKIGIIFHRSNKKGFKSRRQWLSYRQTFKKSQRIKTNNEDKELHHNTHLLLHANQIKNAFKHKCNGCDNKKRKGVSKKKISYHTFGMSLAINLTCQECKGVGVVSPLASSFAGKDFTGSPSRQPNKSWYEANIRFVH